MKTILRFFMLLTAAASFYPFSEFTAHQALTRLSIAAIVVLLTEYFVQSAKTPVSWRVDFNEHRNEVKAESDPQNRESQAA